MVSRRICGTGDRAYELPSNEPKKREEGSIETTNEALRIVRETVVRAFTRWIVIEVGRRQDLFINVTVGATSTERMLRRAKGTMIRLLVTTSTPILISILARSHLLLIVKASCTQIPSWTTRNRHGIREPAVHHKERRATNCVAQGEAGF